MKPRGSWAYDRRRISFKILGESHPGDEQAGPLHESDNSELAEEKPRRDRRPKKDGEAAQRGTKPLLEVSHRRLQGNCRDNRS